MVRTERVACVIARTTIARKRKEPVCVLVIANPMVTAFRARKVPCLVAEPAARLRHIGGRSRALRACHSFLRHFARSLESYTEKAGEMSVVELSGTLFLRPLVQQLPAMTTARRVHLKAPHASGENTTSCLLALFGFFPLRLWRLTPRFRRAQ